VESDLCYFLCACVDENHSCEFVDPSAVHVTVQILIRVVNLIPAWIIDSEFKFGGDFIHSQIFFFAEMYVQKLLACSIDWHLKVAAVDESERCAAFCINSLYVCRKTLHCSHV
jgi:hypothetical protein